MGVIKKLHKKYGVCISVSKKLWCLADGDIHTTYSLYIEGIGTERFETKKELFDYADKMSKVEVRKDT